MQVLKNNMLYACSQESISVKIVMERGRFFLHTSHIKKATDVLKKVFGIVSFSPVWDTSAELSVLTRDVLNVLSPFINSKTSFALRVRRSGTHEYTSQDVAVHVGQAVCDYFHSSVDLDCPDVELFIEIRDENAFLFVEKIDGVGGLPYGTQGTVGCHVKTMADILASFFLMKRGCFIHFISSNEKTIEQINLFLRRWYIKKSITIYEPTLSENNHQFLQEEYKLHHCDAICTGLTLMEDTEEALTEIKKFQRDFSLPILTPLISMTEQEYQNSIKQVGPNS
jgi:tRNA uracil 4-sulfurtransferase